MLIGDGVEKLSAATVAVFGVGGVGSYVVEALARAGVGGLILVDHDRVAPSNINRQIIALHSTVGQYKTQAAKARILDINPNARVVTHEVFYGPETEAELPLDGCDYIVDAIDTVSAKLLLAEQAQKKRIPIISSMGTGNKLDPTRFEIADIMDTSVCPLARVMRHELKKRGIDRLKVVYSREEPIHPLCEEEPQPGKRTPPGSISFVPSAAGLILAGEVIRDLIRG